MGFKCSLFGCSYGEAELEREREEDGNEVIITERETETCTRCGDVRVLSENKEVTTLETAADIVADDLEDEPDETAPPDDQPPAQHSESEPEPAATETQPTDEDSETPIPDAENEKAVKMAGGGEETTSTGTPPEEIEDDAVILEDDEQTDTPAANGDRDPGEWPEEPDDGDDWEQPTEIEQIREQDEPTVTTTGDAITVPEGEFYCPECEYTTPVESSSLREGDYCPECHRGSLRHEPE